MKAVVFTEYGPPEVLQYRDIEKPVAKDNDVLIKIHASSINFGDTLVRDMKSVTPRNFTMPTPLWLPTRLVFGWSKPRTNILGAQFAGEIVAAGKDVTRFKVGDEVFAYRGPKMGGNAEFLAMPEDGMLAIKPANMSYAEAATVPYGAIMAFPILKKANIQPGQKVLIIGASGGIGSLAVQYAKHHGAQVTGVCGTRRVDFVKALGADHVIDYTQQDFTRNGETYDLIFDVLGTNSFRKVKHSLTPNGIYLLSSFKTRQVFQMLWTSLRGGRKVICALSPENIEDLVFARELSESGHLKTVIDRSFPLKEAVKAHRYIESGNKQGHVVLTIDHAS